MTIKKAISKIADIIIPRFMTEDTAVIVHGQGHIECVCCMNDVQPGEVFDGVATVRLFNLFGFAVLPCVIGDVRPWPSA